MTEPTPPRQPGPPAVAAAGGDGAVGPWGGGRVILHVDMDAFFVAVEQRRDPSLVGRPVVVGGAGERGVVAAASYEARAYGVHSAMPSVRARRLCPDAVFLPGDHGAYREVSRRVMELFRSYTPLVEPVSLDEAFLDATGIMRRWADPPSLAQAVRTRVWEEESLRCSVGVAPNKFLAKLASEDAKPRAGLDGVRAGPGVAVVVPGAEVSFLHPLPVERLWGVGPATKSRLDRLGVTTVGDLAEVPVETVTAALGGAVGRHLHALAHGRDDREVEPEQAPKSIGHEETFAHDHHGLDTLWPEALRMAHAVASRLRDHALAARTVTVKVRFGDFHTITRSVTLEEPADAGPALARAARGLLEGVDPAPGVRLLGVSASGLTDAATRQLSLFPGEGGSDPSDTGWADTTAAVDSIRGRFGDAAIGPAALIGPSGLRVKRRGDQQWGPDSQRPQERADSHADFP